MSLARFRTGLLVLAALVQAASSARAQSTAPLAGDVRPAVVDCTLEDLAWMTGEWRGVEAGLSTTETWLAPEGGIMLGLHRDVFGPDRAFFEFLWIAPDTSGVPVLHASPRGRPATPFRRTACGPRRVVFENPDHDHPQRIVYERDAEVLIARIEGIEDGEAKSSEWRWSRSGVAEDRPDLSRLHDQQKTAHLEKDAELLVSMFADDFVEVAGGEIRRPTREESLRRFREYFESVEFLEWEDVVPPIVRISGNGTLAHAIVHKRVRFHPVGEPAEVENVVFAWVETWEKRSEEWKLTSVTSTRRPGEVR